MLIAVIGTVGVPAAYGGFETLVDNILDEHGDAYLVYCSGKKYSQRLTSYKGAELAYLPIDANGASSVLYDMVSFVHAVYRKADALLVLGVSGTLMLPIVKMFTRAKIITNIDGLEWRRDKWSGLAKRFLKWSERVAVRYSDVVISDNEAIRGYVSAEYGVESIVIAYGGDHVLVEPLSGKAEQYAFGVCRIEPENNVHVILEAFSKSGYELRMVGNWSASQYGIALKEKYSGVSNLSLVEPIYDMHTLFTLRDRCSFYVHGHSAGGTNPSLVEAMFFSKPIIAFDCLYNRITMEGAGAYFSSAEDLAELISQFGVSKEWSSMGETLRNLAERKYKWSKVREKYQNILGVRKSNLGS